MSSMSKFCSPMMGHDGVENPILIILDIWLHMLIIHKEAPIVTILDILLHTLSIQEAGDPMLSILVVGLPMLRLEEFGIPCWKCHVVGHPSWSLREVVLPSCSFKIMEDEMVSYITLTMSTFGFIEASMTKETTRIEALIMLPCFWTAITPWIGSPISFTITHGDGLFITWDIGIWLFQCGKDVYTIEDLSLMIP